ncbi:geranylgeranylglyceryl/heptaprenylglyceryl phosphate synthase [Actinomyces wuliandei]|uniref:geranylgeranylglyceryl/heptaprenylglyceryl phosphate synthase n=1 Tax=Actinomyces wuliandei TaxID=2057743 RepID=UPI0013E3973F|nr:geranylgeranylglyceryl/heptaprenylglyceryl phosphate synthase [Actinomyces wuliandei]
MTYLHDTTGSAVCIIDPFKLADDEVLERAEAAEELGSPFIVLASTDHPNFRERMTTLVPEVSRAVSVPTLLHFPPTRGEGLPVVQGAAGYLWPALLMSRDPYFVWQSLLESAARWPALLAGATPPEPILCAALTVGPDYLSESVLSTYSLEESRQAVHETACLVRVLGLDMVYLYSRNQRVDPRTCTMFREEILPDQLIFVSGNIRTGEDIAQHLDAGADFVGFAGACEGPDWRERMPDLLTMRSV